MQSKERNMNNNKKTNLPQFVNINITETHAQLHLGEHGQGVICSQKVQVKDPIPDE